MRQQTGTHVAFRRRIPLSLSKGAQVSKSRFAHQQKEPPRNPATSRVSRRVWSWRRWTDYFHNNARTLLPVSWERGTELSEAEREVLLPSLREFQQGEGLEGGHFFRCVRLYAEKTGDWG